MEVNNENKRNLTLFQKLSNRINSQKNNISQSNIGNVEIFKTNDRQEYEVKKLERQQGSYLKQVWGRVNAYIKNQTLTNEARRIPSYYDYELMEEYPIIGAALDIFMEECTTANEKGKVLNIYSNSDRVRKELEILFEERLNIGTSLPMWTRNTCKYGDNFVYLDIDVDKGIVGCKQLPNIEIERDEGNLYTYFTTSNQETVFWWKTTRDISFKEWQVAHFRLLTDDKRLPYGMSVLEKARRIWRNLLLTEDAMRTIRLLRASDRHVFYVNIGNINPNDVEAHMNNIADKYRRTRVVDPNTGQEDIKMNVMGIDQNYFIPTRGDGDNSRIETLQGQTNIDIVDIEYDLKLLCSALRVPKTYLNFEEAQGEGKSLSMQDIRFARTVNRIQQAMLQELNKIAIVHLVSVGLEEELGNFSLTLNNPSIQSDILRTELMQNKISVFKDFVEPLSTGIAPMSIAKAKKTILGMTNDEIIEDLKQQRLERAVGFELLKTEQIITRTGIFDVVDKMYGIDGAEYVTNSSGEPVGSEQGFTSGGGGSFDGSIGGMDSDIEGMDGMDNIEGDLTQGGEDFNVENEPAQNQAENGDLSDNVKMEDLLKDMEKLLIEQKNIKINNIYR